MAVLSTLVKAIAEIEGLEESQVGWVARYLREAGLISQGGRGRGGAQMSVQDAANLLIGVNASPGPKYSVSTVNDFRRLLLTRDLALPENIEDWDEIRGGDDWLSQAFRRGAQCGPAIEAMIRSYMPDEFGNVAHDSSVSASISFVRPSLLCKIAIYYGTLEDPEPIVVADFEPHLIDTEGIQPDRLDETIITGRTLASVGKALSS